MSKSDAIFYVQMFFIYAWIISVSMSIFNLIAKDGESALIWTVTMWIATIGFYFAGKVIKKQT